MLYGLLLLLVVMAALLGGIAALALHLFRERTVASTSKIGATDRRRRASPRPRAGFDQSRDLEEIVSTDLHRQQAGSADAAHARRS